MEIGNEISHKIRSAIKAKLVELGAYEDEELPDYIMVMVANKKTHAQMNEDLHLFLGGSTEKFTSWLQTILNKLKSITIGNPSMMNTVVSREVEDTNNSNSNEDTGVPELLVQTDIDEFAEEQEENNLLSSVEKSSAIEASQLIVHPTTENLKRNFNLSSSSSVHAAAAPAPEAPAPAPPPAPTPAPAPPVKVQLQPSTHYLNPKCSSSVMSHFQKAINAATNQGPPANAGASLAAGYPSNKQLPPRLQMGLMANYPNKQIQKAVTAPLPSQPETDVHLLKVHPQNRKRRIPGSVIGSVIHHSSAEEEEYDPYNPSYGSVASVVRVTERKSSVPPELQANKCLLLKAVKEAHKSLAIEEKRTVERALIKPMQHEIPEKRMKLPEKMQQKRLMYSPPKKPNNMSSYQTDEESYEMDYTEVEMNQVGHDSRLVECKLRPSRIAVLKQAAATPTTTPSPLQGRLMLDSQLDDDLQLSVDCADSSSNFEEDYPNPPPQEINSRIVKDKKRQNPKTQFIVTLDGYDDSQQSGTSVPHSSGAGPIETTNIPVQPSKSLSFNIGDSADEDEEMVEQKSTPEKIVENCKFWPSCQNGTNCKYKHPSVACSRFPNCKFGDKCAYLHPKCKFDTKCNRFDCPFSHNHSQPTVPMPSQVVPILPPPPPVPQPVALALPPAVPAAARPLPQCKFFPTCKNMSCPFNHPKPCRFGISCTKKSFCSFYHPPLPKQNQLRWKADKSFLLNEAADPMVLNLEQWNNNPYKVVNAVNT